VLFEIQDEGQRPVIPPENFICCK